MKANIILIITITICIIILIGVIAPLITEHPYDKEKFSGVIDIIKSMIALIAFYLGQETQKLKKNDSKTTKK